ncbi:MAG TPA: EF-P lysine aminoacylase EpmA [Steroidobacteraceae bacterium]
MPASGDWRPTASAAALGRRAELLARARAFFAHRGVLEVDTPLLVGAPVTDVHIHSARVELEPGDRTLHLATSPEYAMKRLLAAGSGDIYQIAHVVRAGERSRLHNPEFTLIEWYRLGFTLDALMSEVDALARELLGPHAASRPTEIITYRDAFLRQLELDPLTARIAELERAASRRGFVAPPESQAAIARAGVAEAGGAEAQRERDVLLDFLMAAVIGPALGLGALTFIHGYPASQAALAELDPDDPRVALRFELYCDGIELANGFRELASSAEQRARFEHDRRERARAGLLVPQIDERLLAALDEGLPACSGVALGFDRLLMIALGARHIDEVLAFPIERV